MSNENETYFSNGRNYPEAFRTISEYNSMELRDMERMLDALWPDDAGLTQHKLDVLHHYLCEKRHPQRSLPSVSLYNYVF